MASQSLYRKWRSRTFAELIGQDHVRDTLRNAVRSKRVGHAYLFCGPRGTGKTSTARLLAKAINCLNPEDAEPCGSCAMCLAVQEGRSMDLIEIDAASNRGIDEIRDLREKVGFSPAQAAFKFYILDEAHMLTSEAFNALLKTLEEPPAHAIFVLVTTEAHKIPATIVSRCQRFDFHRVRLADLQAKLLRICAEEQLDIEPQALELIARNATGSFRDAESVLDQFMTFGPGRITVGYVHSILGLTPEASVSGLVGALVSRDAAAGLATINDVSDDGMDLRQFNHQIVDQLHHLLLIKSGNADLIAVTSDQMAILRHHAEGCSLHELTRWVRLFSQADASMRGSQQPQLPLELAFLDATTVESAPANPASLQAVTRSSGPPVETFNRQATAAAPARETPQREASPRFAPAPSSPVALHGEPAAAPALAGGAISLDQVKASWHKTLDTVGAVSRSLEGLLKGCEPTALEGNEVSLGFVHRFHRDRIDEPKNRVVVEKALSRVLGHEFRVRCVQLDNAAAAMARESAEAARRQAAAQDPQVKAAQEIFPGARIELAN